MGETGVGCKGGCQPRSIQPAVASRCHSKILELELGQLLTEPSSIQDG